MATIRVNGLALTVACRPGDEARIQTLGKDLDRRVRGMRKAMPGAGDVKLLIAVALSLLAEADEATETGAQQIDADVLARLLTLTERAEGAADALEGRNQTL